MQHMTFKADFATDQVSILDSVLQRGCLIMHEIELVNELLRVHRFKLAAFSAGASHNSCSDDLSLTKITESKSR